MQTLPQFIAHWSGRYCDFDGYYGGQCVDLADFYLRDVWGVPVFFVTGAVDLFGHRQDLIEWIVNNPRDAKQVPLPGDMVIWHLDAKIGTGINGHVDIFVKGASGVDAFTGFDQNWPVGSRPHLQSHAYEGVRGWGRRRRVVPPAPAVVPPSPAPVPPKPPVAPPDVVVVSTPLPPPDPVPPVVVAPTPPQTPWQAFLEFLRKVLGIPL